MTTEKDLVKSAQALEQPSVQAAQEYEARSPELAAKMNGIIENREDLESLIGPGNLAMMRDNHRNHARFMGSLFMNYEPAVLVETVIWVFRAYRAHGFRLTYWPAQLATWIEVLKAELTPETWAEVYPFYRWMLVNQAAFAALSEPHAN